MSSTQSGDAFIQKQETAGSGGKGNRLQSYEVLDLASSSRTDSNYVASES